MAAKSRNPIALFAFPEHAELGRRIARRMKWPFRQVKVRQFPDGESLVRLPPEPWKGRAVLLCGLHEPNRSLVECLLAVETLRDRGARSVALVSPYMGYMRQDAAFHPGEAVSQRIVGHFLAKYVDRFLTIDAHLHRTARIDQVFGIPCKNLTAAEEIAKRVKALPKPIVIGPDAESAQWVKGVADAAGCPWTVGEKTRKGDRDVSYELGEPSLVPGSTAVLVDDIVSTGNTIIEAARVIARHGPRQIHLYAIHGLFVEGAEAKIRRAGVKQIVSTNTVPHKTNGIDIGDVLTEAFRRGL